MKVNRFPRVLAQAYEEELVSEVRRLHEAVMALVAAHVRAQWRLRYGESVVEASLSDFVYRLREKAAEFFRDDWVQWVAQRFTVGAVQAAVRNLGIELRRALRSKYQGDPLLPQGSLQALQEARILAQVQEIKSIPEKYVTAVARLISDAATTGTPYNVLEDQLEDLLDITEHKAHMIAVTELSRTYNNAAFDRYEHLGVEHVIWVTADDERTCPECAPLDGERMTVDQAHDLLPKHPQPYIEGTKALTLSQGWVLLPEIPLGEKVLGYDPITGCVEWVQVTGKVERFYDGDICVFSWGQGQFATTLHHLVYVGRRGRRRVHWGFVPAHAVSDGAHILLSASGDVGGLPAHVVREGRVGRLGASECRDLCEAAVKQGYAVTVEPNGDLAFEKVSDVVARKEERPYRGRVCCLELEKYHVFLLHYQGQAFFGSNCRCTVIADPDELREVVGG